MKEREREKERALGLAVRELFHERKRERASLALSLVFKGDEEKCEYSDMGKYVKVLLIIPLVEYLCASCYHFSDSPFTPCWLLITHDGSVWDDDFLLRRSQANCFPR
jgi:hypothetical protein